MLTTFSGRRASQDEGELTAFIQMLRDRGVTRYAEIGAREGDTFWEVMRALPPKSFGLAVDLPGGLWGKSTTGAQLRKAVIDLQDRGYVTDILLGNSTDPSVQYEIASIGPYDAILIDGDHTYEGVKADWEAYRDLAPIIAFHDIVGEGQFERVTRRGVEVPRLWAEIKACGANVVEFVSPGSAMGIGVVIP
jgi:hypothetical protein